VANLRLERYFVVNNKQRREEIEQSIKELNKLVDDAIEYRMVMFYDNEYSDFKDPRVGVPTEWDLRISTRRSVPLPSNVGYDCYKTPTQFSDSKYIKELKEHQSRFDNGQLTSQDYRADLIVLRNKLKREADRLYSIVDRNRELEKQGKSCDKFFAEEIWDRYSFYASFVRENNVRHLNPHFGKWFNLEVKVSAAQKEQKKLINLYKAYAPHLRQDYIKRLDPIEELLVSHGDLDPWDLMNHSSI